MSRQLDWDYELWATQLWIGYAPSLKNYERASEVIQHITGAQWVWYNRIAAFLGDPECQEAPQGHHQVELERYVRLWKELIIRHGMTVVIDYQDRQGNAYQSELGEILAHVLNHGTYHRGHLRGLAEAEGRDDFPDSDFIFYARCP